MPNFATQAQTPLNASAASQNIPYAFYAPQQASTSPAEANINRGQTARQRPGARFQDSFTPQTQLQPFPIQALSQQEYFQLAQNPLQQAQRLQQLATKAKDDSPEAQQAAQEAAKLETPQQRLAMMTRLERVISPEARQHLQQLLENGTLTETAGDDAHSTLYYLYAMGYAPKAAEVGWNPRLLVEDMLNILANPYNIEQDNTPLLPPYKQALLQTANNPNGDKHAAQVFPTVRQPDDVDVIRTYNCSEAAEMSRMASRNPKELTRQLYELTSPQQAFYEKATPEEILPEDPSGAYAELARRNMNYRRLPDGELLVEVPASRAAVIRAVNTQAQQASGRPVKQKEASPLQVLYQETLLYNGSRKNYDVATDKRDMLDIAMTTVAETENLTPSQQAELVALLNNPKADEARTAFMQRFDEWRGQLNSSETQRILQAVWGENSGLTGDQKMFIERLVNDGKAYQLVQYHALSGPQEINDENYDQLYLYGYYRDFHEIENDLVKAIEAGEEPIVNESMFFKGGHTLAGHEVKLHGTGIDEETGERYFEMVDTDDAQKGIKRVNAREFIPTVGHVTLPKEFAEPILQEMAQLGGGILVPEPADGKDFDLQPIAKMEAPEPSPEATDAKLAALIEELKQQQASDETLTQTSLPTSPNALDLRQR